MTPFSFPVPVWRRVPALEAAEPFKVSELGRNCRKEGRERRERGERGERGVSEREVGEG